MGKLFPKSQTLPGKTSKRPAAVSPPAGPFAQAARHVASTLKEAKGSFELDDLDRLARRYARTPASGAADAIDALADVIARFPQVARGSEVNLDPQRLHAIADRSRGLGLLCDAGERFLGLVKDSQQAQGDEIVELLIVGYNRVRDIAPSVGSTDKVHAALVALGAYHDRVTAEGAHRGEIDREAKAGRRPRKVRPVNTARPKVAP